MSSIFVNQGSQTPVTFRNTTGGTYAQRVDTAPWTETPVGSGSTAFNIGTTSVGTTGLSIGTATHVFLSVDPLSPQGIRFWNTGSVPTMTLGHYLAPGTGPIEISNAQSFQVISSGTSSGTIMVSLHAYPT